MTTEVKLEIVELDRFQDFVGRTELLFELDGPDPQEIVRQVADAYRQHLEKWTADYQPIQMHHGRVLSEERWCAICECGRPMAIACEACGASFMRDRGDQKGFEADAK